MNLQEYIKKLEAAQACLPEMLADVARKPSSGPWKRRRIRPRLRLTA